MPWADDGGRSWAAAALAAYGLPLDTPLRLISLSENATFLVGEAPPLGVLRVYRPNYQTDIAKRSELAWIDEILSSEVVATPEVISNESQERLTRVDIDGDARDCVMFQFIEGCELATSGQSNADLSVYGDVGQIVARLHLQVLQWQRPEWFERMHWNVETILGADAPWGDWRDAVAPLDAAEIETIERAEARLRERLAGYPQTARNSGLVHCDMRTTNVMADPDGKLWVIDFDDAGFSWLLWDLCSTTSFVEHESSLDGIVNAWLDGYQRVRALEARDLEMVPDLVFLRRLHLLAWIGSHPDASAAIEIGAAHAAGTVDIARQYLEGEFLSGARLESLAVES